MSSPHPVGFSESTSVLLKPESWTPLTSYWRRSPAASAPSPQRLSLLQSGSGDRLELLSERLLIGMSTLGGTSRTTIPAKWRCPAFGPVPGGQFEPHALCERMDTAYMTPARSRLTLRLLACWVAALAAGGGGARASSPYSGRTCVEDLTAF
jgi:hypothetical protein